MFDNPNLNKAPYVQVMQRPVLGVVVKIPANPTEDNYKEPTDQERRIIYEIITTVARTGWINLGMKKGHIEQLGAQIGHLHPLQFLGTIFSSAELKDCMIDIFNSGLKRDRFMNGGLTANLNREAEKKKLTNHLDDFSKKVGASKEKLAEFFATRQWEEMVRYLIEN